MGSILGRGAVCEGWEVWEVSRAAAEWEEDGFQETVPVSPASCGGLRPQGGSDWVGSGARKYLG